VKETEEEEERHRVGEKEIKTHLEGKRNRDPGRGKANKRNIYTERER